VLACAVHVPLGLANIAREWWRFSDARRCGRLARFGLLLLVLGLRAVWGSTRGPEL
jgi:fumarate reductase subunit C